MASKPKRAPRYDLKAAGRKRSIAIQVGLVAVVVVFAAAVIGYIVFKKPPTGDRVVRVASEKVIKDGDGNPKVVISLYEDFLCPACGYFEQTLGPTVSRAIDTGAVAVEYRMLANLDSAETDHYSSRAAAAAYCVADDSDEAFRRFHTALFTVDLQPAETHGPYPDDAQLIERARQAGVVGKVPDCVKSGKYLKLVKGLGALTGVHATPTMRINGTDYQWSVKGPTDPDADLSDPAARAAQLARDAQASREALVAKIKEIVGEVPGLEAVAPVDNPSVNPTENPTPATAPATP